MPHILMRLMRHAEIATTMNYYSGRDAVAAADVIWNTEKVDLGDNGKNISYTPLEAPSQTHTE